MKFLKIARYNLKFFKRIRIGINLAFRSIKAITFHHDDYAIFCVIITLIQIIRVELTGIVNNSSISTQVTESLMGQNFFEIMVDYPPFSRFSSPIIIIKSIGLGTFFYYIELVIIFYVNCAIAYYVSNKIITNKTKIYQSFKIVSKQIPTILIWSLINMLILILPAFLGFFGDMIEFAWNLSTVFIIPLIALEKINFTSILKKALKIFKQRFSNILGVDIALDFILIVISAIFAYFYQRQKVPTFTFLVNLKTYSIIPMFILFYLGLIVVVAETIAITYFYEKYVKNDK